MQKKQTKEERMSSMIFLDFDEGPLQGAMDICCEL